MSLELPYQLEPRMWTEEKLKVLERVGGMDCPCRPVGLHS